jgi:hypothetical protein
MENGYLLDFSDRTFGDFFHEEVGVDPDAGLGSRSFSGRGPSKAKRLRSFIEKAQPHLVARALRALREYRDDSMLTMSEPREAQFKETYFRIVASFEGDDQTIDSSEIHTAFSADGSISPQRFRNCSEGPFSTVRRRSDLSRSGCEALLCGAYVNALDIRSVHS